MTNQKTSISRRGWASGSISLGHCGAAPFRPDIAFGGWHCERQLIAPLAHAPLYEAGSGKLCLEPPIRGPAPHVKRVGGEGEILEHP